MHPILFERNLSFVLVNAEDLKIVLCCYNRRGGGAMQHCHSQEIMSLKVSNRDDMVQQQAQF